MNENVIFENNKFMNNVAIQGIKGCNHHIAAAECGMYGTDFNLVECATFRDLAESVAGGSHGIMAIENTIAGAILPNYQLIMEHSLKVVGEWKLRIKHSLAALPGSKIEEITEVDSHPMALLQCSDFLNSLLARNPLLKVVQQEDTAGSAKMIAQNRLEGHAAICPSFAAELYGLEILKDGIETNKRNFTRFMLLENSGASEKSEQSGEMGISEISGASKFPEASKASDTSEVSGTSWKASIVISVAHLSGSLSKVLSILSIYDMNLTMLQSVPIIGREWEYRFYVDLVFSDYSRYRLALEAVRPLTNELIVLGEYREYRGNRESK